MAGVTHTFVSAKADDGDATLTRPSDWNSEHTVADQFLGSTGNKDQAAALTTADGQTTGLTIAATPAAKSYVAILVNGDLQTLGDGVKTKDCYFSVDAGATARAIADVVSGDTLFWNGSIAGFELATSDSISMLYPKA